MTRSTWAARPAACCASTRARCVAPSSTGRAQTSWARQSASKRRAPQSILGALLGTPHRACLTLTLTLTGGLSLHRSAAARWTAHRGERRAHVRLRDAGRPQRRRLRGASDFAATRALCRPTVDQLQTNRTPPTLSSPLHLAGVGRGAAEGRERHVPRAPPPRVPRPGRARGAAQVLLRRLHRTSREGEAPPHLSAPHLISLTSPRPPPTSHCR